VNKRFYKQHLSWFFFISSCPYYIMSLRVGLLADQAFGSSWNMERYST